MCRLSSRNALFCLYNGDEKQIKCLLNEVPCA